VGVVGWVVVGLDWGVLDSGLVLGGNCSNPGCVGASFYAGYVVVCMCLIFLFMAELEYQTG